MKRATPIESGARRGRHALLAGGTTVFVVAISWLVPLDARLWLWLGLGVPLLLIATLGMFRMHLGSIVAALSYAVSVVVVAEPSAAREDASLWGLMQYLAALGAIAAVLVGVVLRIGRDVALERGEERDLAASSRSSASQGDLVP